MADGFLRWPKIMPAWAYRDPATIGESTPISGTVPHETVQAPAQRRDRHYTQARRLHIRNLMRKLP
jgi:hypothetical protein